MEIDLQQYLSQKTKIYDFPVSMLIPFEDNPRDNDDAVEPTAESIRTFGFKVPMVIDRNMVIVCGHTRYKAAKRIGLETVPCIYADDLSPAEVEEFRLADNKTGEIATWDEKSLLRNLQKIADEDPQMDMEKFGFESTDDLLKRLAQEEGTDLNSLADDDDVDLSSLLDKDPRIKRGEVWKIGRHRLMCGDSTSEADVQKLMGGEEADLLLTDPPYGVSYEGNNGMTIDNDSLEDAEFIDFLKKAFTAADSVLKPGAAFYIWHADSKGYEFRTACKEIGWTIRQCLIWVKNSMVMGRQDYQWKHEPCLYGWTDGAGHTWASDRKQTTVLEFDRPVKSDIHPTMKPVPLFEYQVRNSSLEGQNVLDLFCGSGTTGVACERSNRTAYLMEYDPKYAEAAISRLEEVTGETAEKVEG